MWFRRPGLERYSMRGGGGGLVVGAYRMVDVVVLLRAVLLGSRGDGVGDEDGDGGRRRSV